MARIADDDELAAAFDQMKAAQSNVLNQPVAANLSLNVFNGPADNAAKSGSFCTEYLFAPLRVWIIAAKGSVLDMHGA